jgi:type I restriction enzyme S subunit
MPLKHVSTVDNSGCYGDDPEGFELTAPVATTAQINAEGKFNLAAMPVRGFREDEFNRYSCKPGQILVVKSSGSATNIISGKAGLVTQKEEGFVFSNFLLRITPDKNTVVPKFVYALLTSHLTRERIKKMCSTTTYPNLSVPDYSSALLPIPPLVEQIQIANFLDHETAKIDILIDKQQQLIKLLKEKRQAVISHAVTKGLNPDVPMKESGVEWLGAVPEGWSVAKLSYRYEVLLGKMLDDKKITGAYLGKYLRNTDVQWDRINTDDLPEMDFRPDEQERFSVKKGDLIVCEGGEIGRSAIWEKGESCFYQKALHRLRPADSRKDNSRFMFYVLNDAVHQERFVSGAGKATIAHLPAETFKQYRFGFPPLHEQLLIAKHLDVIKAKFDLVEQKANSQIELLKERRTALISAAVTGKIDVRNWQPVGCGEARTASIWGGRK